MQQQKRVGTFTLGICLVLFGVLFLVHILMPALNYVIIFHFWPILLILLGGEILYSCLIDRDCHLKYDGGALFIIFCVALFAVGMAGLDFLITSFPEYIHLG